MWKKQLRDLVRDETGPAVIEDGLILAFVALLLIGGLVLATGALNNMFGEVSNAVGNATGQTAVSTPGSGGGSGGGSRGGSGGGTVPTPTATSVATRTPTATAPR